MSTAANDPERIPVVVASGQSIERTELVTPVDLMARACEEAFAAAPGLRDRIDRLSVVDVMTRSGPALAGELAGRIGAQPGACESTTVGGNSPQWLVSRAASDISAGTLSVTVIAGAEAIRSSRARRAAGLPPELGATDLPPDPVVGDDLPGVGPGEAAIGLMAPVHVYPLFESVVAARAGRDSSEHRRAMGALLAPFTDVAAANPYAWFREVRTPGDIADPAPDNRIVSEPYTKRMCAFLGSDQGAALVVCSLAAARRAGIADRAVFIWSGSEATDVRFPTARPDPGRSPAIAAAGRAALAAASSASGRRAGRDRDRRHRRSRHLLVLPLGRRVGHRRAGYRHGRLEGSDGDRRTPLLRWAGQQLHDPRHRHRDRPRPRPGLHQGPPGSRRRRGFGDPSGPGHRARVVHHQARHRDLCQRAAAEGVPPWRHLGGPGRHRRRRRGGGARRRGPDRGPPSSPPP